MTPPRQNLPGTTWLVTRRCSERRFFLRPDSFVVRALCFVLGYVAAFYGVQVNAVVQMSNHWHLIITDLRGRKSRFLQVAHSLIGRAVNAFRGRFEALSADIAARVQILYGGSMKGENAAGLLSMPDIDGGLIGGASLKADDFLAIAKAAAQCAKND